MMGGQNDIAELIWFVRWLARRNQDNCRRRCAKMCGATVISALLVHATERRPREKWP